MGVGVGVGVGGALGSPMDCPHESQNEACASRSAPHDGHTRARFAPQPLQNLASSRLSWPHDGQSIVGRPGSLRLGARQWCVKTAALSNVGGLEGEVRASELCRREGTREAWRAGWDSNPRLPDQKAESDAQVLGP